MVDKSREFFVGVPHFANLTYTTFIHEGDLSVSPLRVPFYFSMRQNLFNSVPDKVLALAAPIVAYWTASLFFYCLDTSGWTWLAKYRIHESDEVKSRNHASRSQVLRAVILQHTLQSLIGYYWLCDPPKISPSNCMMEMEAVGQIVVRLVRLAVGPDAANNFLALRGADLTHWLYWWAIPAAQLFFSLLVVDTWQYFIHRWMHSNKYLYKIHSVHHRLYIPYAFGASYSHPVEGLLIDCVSMMVGVTAAELSVRQSILLCTISSIKAVDDHCGYKLPYDPFQMFTGNGADFHDIHHQAIGVKFNFSQPFFVHWDVILGTRMSRKDFDERKRKLKRV